MDEYTRLVENIKKIKHEFDIDNIDDYKELLDFLDMVSHLRLDNDEINNLIEELIDYINTKNKEEKAINSNKVRLTVEYINRNFLWNGFQEDVDFEKR